MKLSKETLGKIVDYFSSKPEIAAVYLYGSFAQNEAKIGSDIDLGVVFKQRQTQPFAVPEVQMTEDLNGRVGKEVEVQNLQSCRIDFSHRVISEGKLIYSGDEKARVEFEEKVIRGYFDLKPMLDEYYYYLLQMAKKGELGARYIQD